MQRLSKLLKHGALHLEKEGSAEFDKADKDDSEFEDIDDYIEEDEEFGGASRAVKMSIKAFNFNMMLHKSE